MLRSLTGLLHAGGVDSTEVLRSRFGRVDAKPGLAEIRTSLKASLSAKPGLDLSTKPGLVSTFPADSRIPAPSPIVAGGRDPPRSSGAGTRCIAAGRWPRPVGPPPTPGPPASPEPPLLPPGRRGRPEAGTRW